jgi:predicted nucleic acid-binding protein
MKTVYIETSIISYLTSRPSKDIIAAAKQQLTSNWWERKRGEFQLYISSVVEDEVSKGDRSAAENRLAQIVDLPRLATTAEVVTLATALVHRRIMPAKAIDDALHFALAAVHGVDYLLTWNCRHIDNAEKKPLFRKLCQEMGLPFPEICTPEELMGDMENA